MTNVMIVVQGQNDAKAALQSVKRDLAGVREEAESSNRALGNLGGMLGTGLKVAAGAAGAAALAALGGMVALGVKGTKQAANFQQQMAGVQAVLQATDAEAAQLAEHAQALGIDPQLKVRASEAANVMEMLAKNGLDVTQMLGGATRATILLSNATGTDMAFSADVATDAMQLFGKSAGEMEEVVAGIVATTNSSKFDLQDYYYALSRGGAVAANVGMSFEDFNTLIASTASNFSGGARAGTGFARLLNQLVPTTDSAKQAMLELGLATADGKSLFFDEQGVLIQTTGIITKLQEAFGDLSAEQQISYAQAIFGMEGYGALSGVLKINVDEYEELRKKMTDVDALNQSAATRVNTMSGQWEIFQSVMEGVNLQIGQKFLPSLQQLVTQLTPQLARLAPLLIGAFDLPANLIANAIPRMVSGVSGVIDGLERLSSFITRFRTETVRFNIGDWFYLDTSKGALANLKIGDFLDVKELQGPLTTIDINSIVKVTGMIDWVQQVATVDLGKFVHAELWWGEDIVIRGNFKEALQTSLEIKAGGKIEYALQAGDFNVSFQRARGLIGLALTSESFEATFNRIGALIGLTVTGADFEVNFLKDAGLIQLTLGDASIIEASYDADGGPIAVNLDAGLFEAAFDSVNGMVNLEVTGADFDASFTKLGGQILLTLNDQDFQVNFGAIKKSITAALAQMQADILAAYEEGGLAGAGQEVGSILAGWAGEIKGAVQQAFASVSWADVQGTADGWAAAIRGHVEQAFSSVAWTNVQMTAITWALEVRGYVEGALSAVDWADVQGTVGRWAETLTGYVEEAFTGLSDAVARLDTEGIATSFNELLGSVTASLGQFSEIRTEAVSAVATGVADTLTSVLDVATRFMLAINPQRVADAATGWANSMAELAAAINNEEALAEVAAGGGRLVAAFVTQLGEVLGSEGFGKDIGKAVGETTAAMARGAAVLAKNFAKELANVDWGQFASQIGVFVEGFMEALMSALYEQLVPTPVKEARGGLQAGLQEVDTGLNAALDALRERLLQMTEDTRVGGWLQGASEWGERKKREMGEQGLELRLMGPLPQKGPAAGLGPPAELPVKPVITEPPEIPDTWPPAEVPAKPKFDFSGVQDALQGLRESGALGGGLEPIPLKGEIETIEIVIPDWQGNVPPQPRPGGKGVYAPIPLAGQVSAENILLPEEPITVPLQAERAPVQEQPEPSGFLPQLTGGLSEAASTVQSAASQLAGFSLEAPEIKMPEFHWPPLPSWNWPRIPRPGWLSDLKLPRPGWLGELLAWRPEVVLLAPRAAAFQLGTGYAPGGWSLVGEGGPELMYVPRGSRIYPHDETEKMVRGGDVIVNMEVYARTEMDFEAAAYRVGDVIRRRTR